MRRALEPGLGRLIGAGVGADVVHGLQPVGESAVEIVQTLGGVAGLAQERFEILLDRAKEAFDFSFAPRVVRLGVQQANLQIGADQAGVVVGEGTALVGIEFARQTAALQRFLEREMKRAGVGFPMVEGGDDQPGVIIDEGTEVSGLSGGVTFAQQVGSGRKVGHPKFINGRSFESFGGTADGLAELITPGALIEIMGLETAVDGTEGGQRGIVFAPLAVEDFDGDAGVSAHGGQQALALFGSEDAGKTAIRAGLGMQGREATAAEGIPPIFEGADGDHELQAIRALDGGTCDRCQGRAQGQTLVDEVLNFGNEGETLQGQGLGGVHRSAFCHRPHDERSKTSRKNKAVWDRDSHAGWGACPGINPGRRQR